MNITQYRAILFDWGDTIMIDFPDKPGKMRDWDVIEPIPNAKKVLSILSGKTKCYLVTGANDSTEVDIIVALARVELNHYFTGIFCYRNIGSKKNERRFYLEVLSQLQVTSDKVIMIGNDLENDVMIPISCGIKSILFDSNNKYHDYHGEKIADLIELI